MFWRQKHRVMALSALLSSCSTVGAPTTFGSQEEDVGTQVFTAVLTGFQEKIQLDFRVDPRPVAIPDFVGYPDSTDYYPRFEHVTAARIAVLSSHGIDTVRSFPVVITCEGPLAPPPKDTSGCPSEDRIEVAFDTVRAGAERGMWLLRMMQIDYTPRYRSATISEITVVKEKTRYVLKGIEPIVFID